MRETHLPFSPPLIGQEEIDEVVDTLRSDWLTTGPKTKQFEQDFARFTQAPAALALNSCTAGLHTALVAHNIGPGDEVITTPLTFAASVNVIEHVGARPVLVDVEPDTLNIDPRQIARAITDRTKAILPVHFAGHPVDLDAINALAEENNLCVIEDAAHAPSAQYKGRMIGSGDNPTAFSFYATKNMTTGEGGMLTGSPEFLEQARVISLHGLSRDAWQRYDEKGSWKYDVVCPGFKYNMTDLQASLGIWQLRKLESFQQRRVQIVAAYQEAFAESLAFQLPAEREEVVHAWHLYVLRLLPNALPISRDEFIQEMKKRKIGVSVHFIPIHLHSYYRNKYGYRADDFPVAHDNYQQSFSLPLHPGMTDQDVADVIHAVREIVTQCRRKRGAAA